MLWKSYDFYGCLFGVRNTTGLTPTAERRGLPSDVKEEAKDWEREQEEEEAERRKTGSFGFYEHRENPVLEKYRSCPYHDAHSHSWVTLDELLKINLNEAVPEDHVVVEGRQPLKDRADAMGSYYTKLVELMQKFSDKYAPEDIRVVVWFKG